MIKLVLISSICWGVIFAVRVISMGGIDQFYQEPAHELLKPQREYLSQVIRGFLPYPQSALLSGIVLGQQSQIPFNLKTQLQETSTIHMVVASGQNLSILVGFLINVVYTVGRRKTIVLSFLAIIIYVLLTGSGIPVVRAAIMAMTVFVGQIFGRDRLDWWILLLTAGAMLLFQPNWITSISFQLSFLATLAIIVVAPVLIKAGYFLPSIFREILAVSLAAQLLTLPIIAYNFQTLSVIGILANILIGWSISLILISGFWLLGLSLVSGLISQIVSLVPAVLLTYFIYIVNFLSGVPFASINLGDSSGVFWVGYYLLLVAIIWFIDIKTRLSAQSA